MSARQEWIGILRLIVAFLLTPVIILVWLSISFDVVTWHREFDGPAGVVLAFFVFPAVVLTLLLVAKDNLKFRVIALTTASMALTSGLLIWLATWPWGVISFAPALGGLSALGIIVSALSFYFIGVWRTVAKK